ncbi:META domain-containing protein [Streptomyces sp. NPDC001780]
MRKQQIIPVTAVTTVALLSLAACGTESGAGSGSGPGSSASKQGKGSGSVRTDLPLTGVRWAVDSVTVDGKKAVPPAGASVEIDDRGQASARTGCNSIGAKVTVDGDTVTVGDKRTTEIGCEKELQDFEKALNGAFSGKLTAKVQGEAKDRRLTLTTSDGAATIALSSQPDSSLIGTKWSVSALTDGDVAASLPRGTDGKAYFTFSEQAGKEEAGKEAGGGTDKSEGAKDGTEGAKDKTEGTLKGNLGCNRFSAPATVSVSGSTISVGRIVSTRMSCAEPEMKLEQQVRKVLEGQITYELRHRSLTLETEGGQGLDAVAASREPSGRAAPPRA